MKMTLNDMELRVLGCLIEKELATPEYYPLTLNSLTAACNQKSNRDPVMALTEAEVAATLDALRAKGMARLSAEGVRAAKYCHSLSERLQLEPPELAVLAELMLRGPQTVGELRLRGERMYPFPDLASVESVVQELQEADRHLITRLPRQPGQKEARFAHLLAGEPQITSSIPAAPSAAVLLPATADDDRIDRLTEEVALLRAEVGELRRLVEEFKAQFE